MASSRNLLTVLAIMLFSAALPTRALAQDSALGRELFELCGQCHGPDGEGELLYRAPSIAGMHQWYLQRQLEKFRSGLRGTHPDDVAGLRMYPMSLSLKTEEDLQAVAAYVASRPAKRPEPLLEGGDPAVGEPLYAPCATCHGVDASGNEALGGPALKYSSDWYLLTQLQNFKAGIRGGDPRDVQGVLMRAMAMTLVDERAIQDVVAYIMTLRN